MINFIELFIGILIGSLLSPILKYLMSTICDKFLLSHWYGREVKDYESGIDKCLICGRTKSETGDFKDGKKARISKALN